MADKMIMTQEMVEEIWQAFTTLSDAQDVLEAGDTKLSHSEMNHAKRHLSQVLLTLPDETRRTAIFNTFTCSLKIGVDVG